MDEATTGTGSASPGRRAPSPGDPLLARVRRFVRTLVSESADDRVPGLAAETAFFGVLSLFPGLLILTSLLGLLDVVIGGDVATEARDRVTGAMNAVLTDRASGAVRSVAELFEGSHGGVLTFATIGALVSLSGAFASIVGALNLAYDTEEHRSWWQRRLLGLLLGVATVVVVVLLVVVLVVGPLLGQGPELAELVGLGAVFAALWDLLRLPIVLLGATLWALALFHLAPNRRTRWREAVPGALLTAVLWVVATGGFSLYLRLVGDQNPVLGAFGGGIIVMTWAYLLSLALLVGGELNAILLDHRHQPRHPPDGSSRMRQP